MRVSLQEAIVVILSAVVLSLVVGCESPSEPVSGEEAQRAQTEQMHSEAHRQVGMPELTNFQELEFAKTILEMRDDAITTYTYMIDMNGNRHFVCRSLGYGLPYSTQMTNPEREQRTVQNNGGSTSVTLPQPEPSGLYMPDSVDATWIICDDGDGGIDPVYSEPQLLVSPFKMHEDGDNDGSADEEG